MKHLLGVEPFDDELLAKAETLRRQIAVPPEIDSPFFVARFLRGGRGDEALTLRRLREYLAHRALLGYDKLDDLAILRELPLTKATYERFAISKMDASRRTNNCHVIVQKMTDSDLKEIVKVIPLSFVLHSYFSLQEMFGRCIAQTERETGRPSAVICVLDLSGLCLSDFVNPLGGPAKLARLVVKIWAEYFSETLVLIHPPGLVSLICRITRCLMDEATAARLSVLQNVDDLVQLLEPHTVPSVYGGTWIDRSGFADPPESCVNAVKPVRAHEYRHPHDLWHENGFIAPPLAKTFTVKGKTKHDVHRRCTSDGQLLVWQFEVSSDIDFEVLKVEAGGLEKTVWPRLTLTSLKVAEYGVLACTCGEYVLRFSNPAATWFPAKISLAAEIK